MPQITTVQQLRSAEIDFYTHEIYDGDRLIARITYDHQDFVTQRWIVEVNGEEIFRGIAQLKCHDFVTWHYKQGTLPVQQPEVPDATTGNEVMCEIAAQCEQFGYELRDDGIYRNGERLGSVGCTDGQWWCVRASSSDKSCHHSAFWAFLALDEDETYQAGLLKEETPSATTSNEVMARIAQACVALGYELRSDGIYYQEKRLKEVVRKDGTYCYVQSLPAEPSSAGDSLDWLDKSFEELTADEWLMLAEYEPAQESIAA